MRISSVLQAKSPGSPCVIYQRQNQTTSKRALSYSLTYQSASKVLKQHEEIIQTKIRDEAFSNSSTTNNSNKQHVVVAILANNSIDLLLAALACTRLQYALPVLLNTRWTHQEIAHALQSQNRNDRTIIMYDDDDDENHANRARQAAGLLQENHRQVSLLRLSMLSLSFRTLVSPSPTGKQNKHNNNNNLPPSVPDLSHDDTHDDNDTTALILFTSGTTSGSKGVLLSHRALYIQALAKLQQPCGYDQNTKMLATTVPFFHVGGLSSALAVLLAGGSLVFPPHTSSRGFQPAQVLRSLRQGPGFSSNTLVVVPAMLSVLLGRLDQTDDDDDESVFQAVRLVIIGGQSASSLMVQHIFERFPNARVVQTYACTEGASSLTFRERKYSAMEGRACTLDSSQGISASSGVGGQGTNQAMGDCVGLPPCHVELQLFPTGESIDTGRKARSESYPTGVIATRGPHILTGYWRRGGSGGSHYANGTKQQQQQQQQSSIYTFDSPLTPDGWFVTNDLGYRDAQGRYYFCGRVADVIRTGGETVLAPEVERILSRHDQILECAVFALPDPKFGETVCAAIVAVSSSSSNNSNTNNSPSLTELRSWCAQQGLAGYKGPRRLFPVTELPRNSSGKLLKRLLIDRFRSHPPKDAGATPAIDSISYRSKL